MSSERHFLDSSAAQEGESPIERFTSQAQVHSPKAFLRHCPEANYERTTPRTSSSFD